MAPPGYDYDTDAYLDCVNNLCSTDLSPAYNRDDTTHAGHASVAACAEECTLRSNCKGFNWHTATAGPNSGKPCELSAGTLVDETWSSSFGYEAYVKKDGWVTAAPRMPKSV